MKYKFGEILEIIWYDTTTQNGWVDRETLEREEPMRCRTVGYFFGQNKKCITVAKSVSEEEEQGLDAQSLPINCIVSIRRLGRKK